MRLGLDAGIFVKDAMRHFWKIANRTFIACAGKIFGESLGKIFGEIVFGNNAQKTPEKYKSNIKSVY